MTDLKKKKERLKQSTEAHKKAIDQNLAELTSQVQHKATYIAISLGTGLIAVVLYQLLSGGKKNKKHISGRLAKMIKKQIGLYVLIEGRAKIVEYIDSLNESEG